jgi:hypothetical protein
MKRNRQGIAGKGLSIMLPLQVLLYCCHQFARRCPQGTRQLENHAQAQASNALDANPLPLSTVIILGQPHSGTG